MITRKKANLLARPFASHPLSKVVRIVIEKTRFKRVFLAPVMVSAVLLNVVIASPSHAFDYQTSDTSLLNTALLETMTKTESTYILPTVSPIGISQKYNGFHPGLDIRAPRGSKIVSSADGTVIEVQNLATGYGRHVRIAHNGTISTLYAHMDTVFVTVGQRVTKGQEIGTVGMTGWTTGPHLHFEVHEGMAAINPLSILPQ